MSSSFPILYSFRRCPYAMRARMAIAKSNITVELREVVLRNKPQQLLDISAKGTVPVLLLQDGEVIEESLDIMDWALSQNDPEHWLKNELINETQLLIADNDGEFKFYLDRYKYADRFPEQTERFYREKAEFFIQILENKLNSHAYLTGNDCSLADIAIFPFIRQFANVDSEWFNNSQYKQLQNWLKRHIESDLFIAIMDKYPAWHEDNEIMLFNSPK